MLLLRTFLICILLCARLVPTLAQCMSYAVPIAERVNAADVIALGAVVGQSAFRADDGNIYTAFRLQVDAWLKGGSAETEVVVLGMGGEVEDEAQITWPALRLYAGETYILLLESPTPGLAHPGFAALRQSLPVADAQGALHVQSGTCYDLYDLPPMPVEDALATIANLSGCAARTPAGAPYTWTPAPAPAPATRAGITSFSPSTTPAGTIVTGDFVQITGSGFGASPGTVSFKNADDGGTTTISPSFTSDYVTWNNTSITVKVPSNAGSGTIAVNSFLSATPLNIAYSHAHVNSDFMNFTTPTRQRYFLRNKDSQGGYTFNYNTTFAQNASAVAAFERALNTWRCKSRINWRASGTTATGFGNDGTNVVLFDASLPSGVLGRTTSRYKALGTSACSQASTSWWLNEIDVQFIPTPTNRTWEFGPSQPSLTEFDFESVALHELGHAHGLSHRIAPGETMHFSIANGASIRTIATADLNGANAKLAYSTGNMCLSDPTMGTAHVLYNLAGCFSVGTEPEASAQWQVALTAPGTLTVFSPDPRPYEVALFDAQGRIALPLQAVSSGDLPLSLASLPNGLYLCKITAAHSPVPYWAKVVY